MTYHLKWSAEWVIRLGDGTEESSRRMNNALDNLWKFTGELTIPAEYESELLKENIAVDLLTIKNTWTEKVQEVFEEAVLKVPPEKNEKGEKVVDADWWKTGSHTEHLDTYLRKCIPATCAHPRFSMVEYLL